MKICIYGAGAVGCTLAAQLAKTGADISLIARGEHLTALQRNGLQIITKKYEETLSFTCTDDPSSLGQQDYVVIAAKAYSLSEIAPTLSPLLGKETAVVPGCNGVPWWFLQGLECPIKNRQITLLDPENIITKYVAPERIIGGLFYMAAEVVKPGVVTSFSYPRCVIGEPSGAATPRVKKLHNLLKEAGFKDPLSTNIRSQIWLKLCWNVVYNPLGVITGKTSIQMAHDAKIHSKAVKMMEEMKILASRLNIPLDLDIEAHIGLAEKAGDHKPSMLQDYERGKSIEIEAIIGAVVEIAAMLGEDVPEIISVFEQLRACAI